MYSLVFVMIIGSAGEPRFTNEPTPGSDAKPSAFARKCAELPWLQFHQLMDQLGRDKKFSKLKEVYSGGVSKGSYAATVSAREMSEDQAIAFCSRFEIGSSNWTAAMWGLKHQRKAAVIGYIKQQASSEDLQVRACCYLICNDREWPDLLEKAKRDTKCTLPLLGFGAGLGVTVGTTAKKYIDKCEKIKLGQQKNNR